MARLPLPFVDYTSRDFESIKASMVNYLQQRFPSDFTDYSESQLGIAMLEINAYAFDIISYMLDFQVNEVFIETARQRESMIKLAALLGYKLAASTAASVTVTLDANALSQYAGPVLVEGGTQVSAGDLIFEVSQDYTIQRTGSDPNFLYTINGANALPYVEISLLEGETVEDSFIADGSKFQRHLLSRSPLIDGTLTLTVSGVMWTLVDSLVLGDPDDASNTEIYEVLLDKDDLATVVFGDGTAGDIPVDGVVIAAEYRVGGGSAGNLGVAGIQQNISATHLQGSGGGASVVIGAVNNVKGTGGSDREDIEHARFFAPQFARTTDRAVTYNDYFTLCNGYTDGSGVIAKAGIIADPTDGIANVVTIYVWSLNTSGQLSKSGAALKNSLWSFLNERRTLGVWVSPIQDGVNVLVNVDALIRVNDAFDREETLSAVESAINELFKETRVQFENELRVSWIYDTIASVAGVDWLHVRKPDPNLVEGVSDSLEVGSTTLNQSGNTTAQVQIDAPEQRAAGYYCNYRIEVGSQEKKRIINSTASGTVAPFTVRLTVESDFFPTLPPAGGQTYTITHPRRVKLSSSLLSSVDDVYNHRILVLDPATLEGDVQERIILDYDGATKIAVVNEDWVATPVAGQNFVLTQDYRVIDSHALLPGTITINTVR